MEDWFKYRAWDNEEHYYIPDGETNFCHGLMEFWLGRKDCTLTFEQCTGLKDKSGKLVYEGDIVLFEEGTSEDDCWNDVVIRDKEEGIFRFRDSYNPVSDCVVGKINGNIHENKELVGG